MKEYARSIGLDLIGVASAEPFLEEKDRLERRQAEGRGPNPYEPQEIAPRVYPEQLLPGVQAIIAAGISYLQSEEEDAARPNQRSSTAHPGAAHPSGAPSSGGADHSPALRGWLSRYCRGEDYHPLLKAKLTQVAAWLEAQAPGARTLVHVDTGPPLERAVAERAGIGKFGKHTNLITPQYGTWVFLGEILTDLPLPPDQPGVAACGACTLCINACPTQCITEWNLDANRCLSYITQMKGIIPVEYREVMGRRLFGCDDCQTVCPYNRRARPGLHPEFAPRPEVGAEPDLLQIMSMTKSDFRRWFEPTAAGWRGKTTLQRNAIIALGNSGDPAAFEPLARSLESESQVIRAHAAWALGRLARQVPALVPGARKHLTQRRAVELDPAVRVEIDTTLEALDALAPQQDETPHWRQDNSRSAAPGQRNTGRIPR